MDPDKVDAKIEEVQETLNEAIRRLEDKVIQSQQVKHALGALGVLREKTVPPWAAQGILAANMGETPNGKPWTKWWAAGDQFVAGTHELYEMGDNATLGDAIDTVEMAAEDVAETAQRAVKRAAPEVGKAIASASWPLWVTGGIVAAIVWGLR